MNREERRLTARIERCQTQLELHQLGRGEPLYVLGDRLGVPRGAIYRLAGRRSNYVSVHGLPPLWIIEAVATDTGIPIGQLYEEAAAAAKRRSEDGKTQFAERAAN